MAIQISIKHDFSETIDYIIPQFPIYIRGALLSDYHNYSAVSHWHEDIEFIYVLSGNMQYDVNGEVITLHEKEGIMINSRNFHYGYSELKQECKFICIIIHPSLFSGNKYIKDNYITPLIECNALPYLLLLDEDWHQNILHDLMLLYQLNQISDDFFPESQVLASNIFYSLYKNTKNIIHLEKQTQNHSLVQLRKMVHFIQQHYSEPIALEDIAKIGEMGKTSCTATFKTYMHTTPIDYLLALRMAQSVSLLTETDKSITEIAYDVGFHDSSYYTKYFKKYYGMTPREMRAKNNTKHCSCQV